MDSGYNVAPPQSVPYLKNSVSDAIAVTFKML